MYTYNSQNRPQIKRNSEKRLPYYRRGRKPLPQEDKRKTKHVRISTDLIAIATIFENYFESYGQVINDCLAEGLAKRLREVQPRKKYPANINPADWE